MITEDISIEYVDTKTISFTTPSYPTEVGRDQPINVPIAIIQGNEEIGRVNFVYHSCKSCMFVFNFISFIFLF